MPSIIIPPTISSLIQPLPIPGDPLRRSGGGGGGGGLATRDWFTSNYERELYPQYRTAGNIAAPSFRRSGTNGTSYNWWVSSEETPAVEGAGFRHEWNWAAGSAAPQIVMLTDASVALPNDNYATTYTDGANTSYAIGISGTQISYYYQGSQIGATVGYPTSYPQDIIIELKVVAGKLQVFVDDVFKFEYPVAPPATLRFGAKLFYDGEGIKMPTPIGGAWTLSPGVGQIGDVDIPLVAYSSAVVDPTDNRLYNTNITSAGAALGYGPAYTGDGSWGWNAFSLPGENQLTGGFGIAPAEALPNPSYTRWIFTEGGGYSDVYRYINNSETRGELRYDSSFRVYSSRVSSLVIGQGRRSEFRREGGVITFWINGSLIYTFPESYTGAIRPWVMLGNNYSGGGTSRLGGASGYTFYNPNPVHLVS